MKRVRTPPGKKPEGIEGWLIILNTKQRGSNETKAPTYQRIAMTFLFS